MRALIVLLLLSPYQVFADCVKPNFQDVLEKAIGVDNYPLSPEFTMNSGLQQYGVQWLIAKWEGPIDGMLLALNCQGDLLGGIKIGAIETLKTMKIHGLKVPVVKAEYIAGTGTSGYLYKKIGIFAILDKKPVELWNHDLYISGFQTCETSGEEDYKFNINTDGRRISVVGKRTTTYGEFRGSKCTTISKKVEKLSAEVFCWDGKKSFLKCRAPKKEEQKR